MTSVRAEMVLDRLHDPFRVPAMKFRHRVSEEDKIELQMTPMIDIVFQLLVFFIMTFKIVAQEGDFNIKMPLAAPNAGTADDSLLPPLKLRLLADDKRQSGDRRDPAERPSFR